MLPSSSASSTRRRSSRRTSRRTEASSSTLSSSLPSSWSYEERRNTPVPRVTPKKRSTAATVESANGKNNDNDNDNDDDDDDATVDLVSDPSADGDNNDDDDDEHGEEEEDDEENKDVTSGTARKKRIQVVTETPSPKKHKKAAPMVTLSAKVAAVPSSMEASTARALFGAPKRTKDHGGDEDEEDDMEVKEGRPDIPMSIPSTTLKVEAVGSTNSMALPHMRQDCPVHKFVPNVCYTNDLEGLKWNKDYCPLCRCVVCDVPPNLCSNWTRDNRCDFSRHANHCHASIHSNSADGHVWKGLRDESCRYPSLSSASSSLSPNLSHALSGEKGPFPPSDKEAAKNPNLTQCRYCKFYNAFPHADYTMPGIQKKHVDWCQSCGRLPSEKIYSRTPESTRYTAEGHEVFCGKREIPFRIESHDPRKISPFRERWASLLAQDPSWLPYDVKEMDHDNFWHRLGNLPTLSMVMASLPTERPTNSADEDKRTVLMDGLKFSNASEKVMVHLDNERDRRLLEELAYWGFHRHFALVKDWAHSSSCPIGGHIQAFWDKEERRGRFVVWLYLRGSASCGSAFVGQASGMWHYALPLRTSASIASTLAAWLDLEPFALADLLHPHSVVQYRRRRHPAYPLCDFQQDEKKDDDFKERLDALIQAIRTEGGQTQSFRSSLWEAATPCFGGVSSNDISWKGTLRRFYSECLPFEMRGQRQCFSNLQEIIPSFAWALNDSRNRPCPLHSHVRLKDVALIKNSDLDEVCSRVATKTETFPGLFGHLENLGHTAIAEVPGLNVELFEFQRQAVQFAIERENAPAGVQTFWWTELPLQSPSGRRLFYTPILDKVSLTPPRVARGGIIAQEMGLGKTIITLALLLSNPAPQHPASGTSTKGFVPKNDAIGVVGWSSRAAEKRDNPKRGSIFSRGTLVVCSVSLVGQWVDEAKSKLKDPGLVYSYYGSGRKRNPKFLSQCAIVVTTYQTLSSDATYHAKKANSDHYCAPLEQIYWYRVVIDESHTCKHQSNMTKMLLKIEGENKWAVSGTPINTSIDDLRNQLKFIGIEHVDAMFDQFQEEMPAVAGGKHPSRRHQEGPPNGPLNGGPFFFLMRSLLIRHSMKQKTADGSCGLMELPPKEERSITVAFSEEERKRYDELEAKAQKVYNKLKLCRRGVSGEYLRVMAALQPLRMACSGGKLTARDPKKKGTDSDDDDDRDEEEPAANAYQMTEDQGMECSICLENFESPVATTCRPTPHVFCRECITGIISTTDGGHGPCPVCREDLKLRSLRRAIPHQDKDEDEAGSGEDFVFRSKLDRLLLELGKIRDEEPRSKSLVFTQFRSTLDWLKQELPKNGFKYRTLSGSQPMNQRAKALRDFQNDPPTTIFLLSLRAGAVGINLTQANRVFILEPAFNPALEAQAIGRVHRLGQRNSVKIIKLRMETSVETRLAAVVERKYGGGKEKTGEASDGCDAKAAEASRSCLAGSRQVKWHGVGL